ncbi:MAG: hypothetical protein JWQ01_2067 [Massilia sp.]|nr:hypothetical protein [Massilia sp.]
MDISPRIRPAFLVVAGAAGLISLTMTLLTSTRDGRIDWVVVGVPVGLLMGVAATALGNRHGNARIIVSLVAAALCVSSTVLIVQRMAN